MPHPKQTLLSLQANARKSLSQNFLTSPHWASLLVHHALEPKGIEEYWEIGPGLGALSEKLLEQTDRRVRLFEIDKKLAPYLRERFPNAEVIEGDFLKADLKKISEAKRIVVLSNLPYHISSPSLFKLLEEKHRLVRAVLTFQREFAERLCALPRSNDYGALSVVAQLHFEIQSVGVLPPGAFYPAPSIASEALILEPKTQSSDIDTVTEVVKAAFRHRRKKMLSNLKLAFPKAPVEEYLRKLGVSSDARPEEISKDQFMRLADFLKKSLFALLLCFSLTGHCSQDQLYGLGGQTSGRVGSVTADPSHPFSALINPALLPSASGSRFGLSTGSAQTHYSTFEKVQVDSPDFRTERGVPRSENFRLPSVSSSLWAMGFKYPFRAWEQKAGFGIALSGPYDKLRSFRAVTPYDFTTLHYGTSDTQFKATAALGVTLIPSYLDIGVGLTLYMTAAGAADTTFLSENPTGRMALDIGLNAAPVVGAFSRFSPDHRLSLVYRAPIDPLFQQSMEGKLMIGGREIARQSFGFSTTLYYEPATWEMDYEAQTGPFTVSCGLSFQHWRGFRPPFVEVEIPAGEEPQRTRMPLLSLQDTLSPRVSVQYGWVPGHLSTALGYRFRPTPVADLSGPANLLDADTHVVGLSAQYHLTSELTLSLSGQYHVTPARSVVKAESGYIGAPGYTFSANSYSYWISLLAPL